MPELKDTLRTTPPKGFEAVETVPKPPVIPEAVEQKPTFNPLIRCPIPPLNTSPDTLRQFNESGKVPTRRVIPLPVQTGGGQQTTIQQNTTIIQQGSGGGSSATAQLENVNINYPALGFDGVFTTVVQMAKCFQLINVNSSAAIEVRLYGSRQSQGADIARETDTAPPFEVTQGLITDVAFDPAISPFQWNWQNRIGTNSEQPQTNLVYVTILSPGEVNTPPGNLVITYLPLLN